MREPIRPNDLSTLTDATGQVLNIQVANCIRDNVCNGTLPFGGMTNHNVYILTTNIIKLVWGAPYKMVEMHLNCTILVISTMTFVLFRFRHASYQHVYHRDQLRVDSPSGGRF